MEGFTNAEIAATIKYNASRVSAFACIHAHEGISYFEKNTGLERIAAAFHL